MLSIYRCASWSACQAVPAINNIPKGCYDSIARASITTQCEAFGVSALISSRYLNLRHCVCATLKPKETQDGALGRTLSLAFRCAVDVKRYLHSAPAV
jgi:hypothetical protein